MFEDKKPEWERDVQDVDFYGDRVHIDDFKSFYDELFEEDSQNESLFMLALAGYDYRRRPRLNLDVLKHRQLQSSIEDYCKRTDCQPLAVLEAYAVNTFGAKQVARLLEVMIVTLQKAAGVSAKYDPEKGPSLNVDHATPHVKDQGEIRHFATKTLELICASVKRAYNANPKIRTEALKLCRITIWLAGTAALNMYRKSSMELTPGVKSEMENVVGQVLYSLGWLSKQANVDADWELKDDDLRATSLDSVRGYLLALRMHAEKDLGYEYVTLIPEVIRPSTYHEEMQVTAKICARLNDPVAVVQVSQKIIDDLRSRLVSSPWAYAFAEDMASELQARIHMGSRRLGMRPRLLVGPPGAGKTHIALEVAKALGVKSLVVSGGNSHDAMELGGTSKGWGGSTPSPIVTTLAEAQSNTCIVVLDEIDKATGKIGGGHLHNLLLSFLEQESARVFRDKCLGKTVDLSHVMFIGTANSVGNMPAGLLSRFVMCQVREPTKQEMLALVPKILDCMCKDYGLPDGLFDGLFDIDSLPGNIQNLRQLQRIVRLYAQQHFAGKPRLLH